MLGAKAMTENRGRLCGGSYGDSVEAGERAVRLAGDRAGVGVSFGCCGRDIRKSGVQRTSHSRSHQRQPVGKNDIYEGFPLMAGPSPFRILHSHWVCSSRY